MKIFAITIVMLVLFVSKIQAQPSNWIWAKNSGGTESDWANGVCTDNSGNSIITGRYESPSIVFGTTTLTNIGMANIFIAKYDPAGNIVWAKSAGGSFIDEAHCICTDGSGNIYIAGCYISPFISFGNYTITNNGSTNMFVAKYNSQGTCLWANNFGGNLATHAASIKSDANGNIYLTGSFYDPTLTIGSTTLTNSNNSGNSMDMFIAKLDPLGNVIWAKREGGNLDEEGRSLAIDAYGNVFVTGTFISSAITIGPNIITNTGTGNSFIVKYDQAGNALWSRCAIGNTAVTANGICTDPGGNVIACGIYFNPFSFGNFALNNADNTNNTSDIYIVKYNANGGLIWANRAGGIGAELCNGISADVYGNYLITGGFESSTLVFGTFTLTNSGASGRVYVTKYNSLGNILGAISAGGINCYAAGTSVYLDNSGKILTAGYFADNPASFGTNTLTNSGSNDIFIAKSNEMSTSVNELVNSGSRSIFPNPVKEKLYLELSETELTNTIVINDVYGNKILSKKVIELNILTNNSLRILELDLKSLPSGIYFLELLNLSNYETKIFIKD